jgi:hypothetical protein
MNRESLTNSKPIKSGRNKKLGLLALLGVCVAGVATFMGAYESPMHDEASQAHLSTLIDTHRYYQEQHGIIGELIEEGVENQIAITGTLAAISAASTFAKVGIPIVKGIGGIAKNIIFGENIKVRTVDVDKIDAAFNDSRRFVAEIKSKFPNSHAIIAKQRQDLKVHQFELATLVQDIALMA